MEVKGSGIADNLLGEGSPDWDELVFYELVIARLNQKFVKVANKANRAGMVDSEMLDQEERNSWWEEFMREQLSEEPLDTLSDRILQRNGLDQSTIEQRKQGHIDQLIEEYKDKPFDEILYLVTEV